MNKKPSVTIGIPAFEAEKNIKKLIISLINQRAKNVKIDKILIYDDASSDNTYQIAKSIINKKLRVFKGLKNQGFAYSTQFLLDKNQSDIFVLLNDDILIKSLHTIAQLVEPFIYNKKVGICGGKIIPLSTKTFIGKCIYVSTRLYNELGEKYKNGNNRITVDGKILALRKEFSKQLSLNASPTGNLDIFLYFECLKRGYQYQFVKTAEIYYLLPETIADFRNRELRSIRSRKLMKQHFGNIVDQELAVPKRIYYPTLIKTLLRYPLESLFFKLIINSYYRLPNNLDFKRWSLATTTKKL